MEVLYNTNSLDMASYMPNISDVTKPHFTFILNQDSSIAQVKTPKANITNVPKDLKVDTDIDGIKKFFEEEVKKLEEQKTAKEAAVEAAKTAKAAVVAEQTAEQTAEQGNQNLMEGGKKKRKTQKKRRTRRNRKNKRNTSKK